MLLFSLLLFIFTIISSVTFYRHERRNGRFEQLFPSDNIDEEWLRQNLLPVPPEVAGAIYHGYVSPREVNTIIHRLAVEKKLTRTVTPNNTEDEANHVIKHNVALELKQPRNNFDGYEHDLVEGLFIDGDRTDTRTIWDWYRKEKKPFHPHEVIKDSQNECVKGHIGDLAGDFKDSYILFSLLWLVALVMLVVNLFSGKGEFLLTLSAMFGGLVLQAVGFMISLEYCGLVQRLRRWRFFLHLCPLLLSAFFVYLTFTYEMSILLGSGLLLLYSSATYHIFTAARSSSTPEQLKLRNDITSAHNYFSELEIETNPEIKSVWYCYLLALNLVTVEDNWIVIYRKSHHTAADSFSYDTGSDSSDTSDGGYSGGGGFFGGGGASGSWDSGGDGGGDD